MSKVIFKQLLIADLSNRKAKIIDFKDGMNLLTSDENHLGKSLICKSLYYALGAEVFFSDVWKKLNSMYSLTFLVDEKEFQIIRKDSMFIVVENNTVVTKYFKIKNLLSKLNEIFNLKIMLVGKDLNKSFIDSSPVFMYTPYYVDQEFGWTAGTESFDKLNQFDKAQRINALYYHLGLLDENYVNLSLKHKLYVEEKSAKEKEAENCRHIIEYMQNFIEGNGDVIVTTEDLNLKICENRDKINGMLLIMEKLRNEIINLENQKAHAIREQDTIISFLSKEKKESRTSRFVICPNCDYEFSIDFEERFQKEYLLETIHVELSSIALSITKCEEKIQDRNKKFVEIRNTLKLLERSIVSDEDLYNLYIKIKSSKSMIIESQLRLGEINMEMEQLKFNSKSVTSQLKKIEIEKADANKRYKFNLSRLFNTLNVSNEEVNANDYSIGDEISASGAYKDRVILSKYYAFLTTKKQLNNTLVEFPLIIDSPRSSEQDKGNSKIIMDFILKDKLLNNQVIVATIDGIEFSNDDENINVIELHNPQHELLSKSCYMKVEEFITGALIALGS